ncbi:hypothetical protein A2334_06180 [Candidatus Roizmanbacteria bacterium RIFOXYB2_FULL_38_10]|uniref:Uncharacterized protein n=1 Tax=Candidatus Roizmanbacteria bacterium RIFOXYD1_FULL_38_12 TaxID=1802093 RepID=A0A1F7L1Z6_9BACT|nr:MAG: hypothetical protein A3K47_05180 [Candidatus Roizmanbacteria bacterium RIFOXYA2_FULL_38_14]OGK64138.1 MAG: hypothetical protein A3K27_05180 [Candidatus Roizmanbacteria bacterium RIFOXYA1_FULL_37_12]OGK65984.1 MAG: hypothetical protein A3K38_05180 [Candidatus Roizmanbacteria bacterium RIFOXYB1_FULL_40_23]OGK68431.1 MAG: hypothetical protein A2334_06180 [Candidatus Roizmanbacteria bacterium RIFOXYB2_FULL_38_10]OGK70389.1 MAG: hypothetical protein A3K21_05185 [Candidatus Roizmanbacteria ba
MLPLFAVYAQGIQEWNDSGCMVDGVPTLKCFEVVFGNILFMASALIVLVLFIMFVMGSFNYLTSLGNPEKIKKAQGTLKYALVGFVLFVSSFLILKIIDLLFLGGNGEIFQFKIGE